MSFRKEVLGELDSHSEAVNVEVCVWLPETVTCVAFTPGVWGLVSVGCCAFEEDQLPGAVYAVDSVLVNAGTFWNIVIKGPSVADGAAAGVSEELEEGVGETEDFAAALEAGVWEDEDVEDAAVSGRNGC